MRFLGWPHVMASSVHSRVAKRSTSCVLAVSMSDGNGRGAKRGVQRPSGASRKPALPERGSRGCGS